MELKCVKQQNSRADWSQLIQNICPGGGRVEGGEGAEEWWKEGRSAAEVRRRG
jgi:hypothetical protein